MKAERFTKAEKSWILYDWANSVYATVMMAAIYPIYFVGFVNGKGGAGDSWWGLGVALSMAVMAVIAPFVGALADYRGYKKALFTGFLALGLVGTLAAAFADFWPLMLVAYALSRIGFSGSCLVYDSFLPDVTSTERMDRVSGFGFAFGYIGGSTIPFVLCIILMQMAPSLGLSTGMAVKLSLIITVLWWGLFSIPFIRHSKQVHYVIKPASGGLMKGTFAAIGATFRKIIAHKGLLFFMLAYFFYIDGVGTVINMSTAYGQTLGLGQVSMILALLVTQIVAVPCSILFSALARRFSSLKMLVCAVWLYVVICVMGFIMGFGLERGWFDVAVATRLFWVVAILVGTVQGGIQATSRSHFAKLAPPEHAGEFFGFFDILGKFAAVLGPALYSFTRMITGSSALAILSLLLLFIIALIFFAIGGRVASP